MTFDQWVTAQGLDYLRDRDHENVIGTAREAWEAAAAAERAKWVAAAWKAFIAGYEDQGWAVLYEMGATGEVPKPTSEGKP